ncbi:transcriptional regulatory protein moc3 [Fusarium avenaceum]|nr:transcriptional regulatory protein moc3 [Fusarium avenaceum]
MTDRKPVNKGRKVKTGCATCRIRKIKCDETKPACQKCVKTGRTCDGYESLFRPFPNQPTNDDRGAAAKQDAAKSMNQSVQGKAPLDVNSLNRYFSTKTLFDVEMSCNQEAHEVLQASFTDPSIRHALLSLRALRENIETPDDSSATPEQQTLGYSYGLEQYSKALTGLASNLAYPDIERLKSALLCCQVLISVEQVRCNFSAMGLHIIRGLDIMREYKPRPYLTATSGLCPPRYGGLPSLDVFIIKMFVAPCRFSEPQAKAPACVLTPPPETPPSDRKLAPNMRTELVRIATATIEFLSKLAQARPETNISLLLQEKEALVSSLDAWVGTLDDLRTESQPQEEPIHANFLRLFHHVLRLVLLGNLNFPPDIDAKLKAENERLQEIANTVNERLKDYNMRYGIASSLEDRAREKR